MTFLSDLARLREAATKGPWTAGHPISKEHYGVCAYDYTYAIPQDINDARLITHLVNHAEAIEELVKAAGMAKESLDRHEEACKGWIDDHHLKTKLALHHALEKLNRSENET